MPRKKKTTESATTSAQTKKTTGKVSVQVGQPAKKSAHVVNLKNPHEEKFADFVKKAKQAAPQKKSVSRILSRPTLPKALPNPNRKLGVNFIGRSKSLLRDSTKAREVKVEMPEHSLEPIMSGGRPVTKEGVEDIFAPAESGGVHFSAPAQWSKKTVGFALTLVLLVLPLQALTYYQSLQGTKDRVLLATNEAIDSLKAGKDAATAFDLEAARANFADAEHNFVLARGEVTALNALTAEIIKLIPSQQKSMESGLALLEAGEIIANTGQLLINSSDYFGEKGDIKDYYLSLVEFKKDIEEAQSQFAIAKEKVLSVDVGSLPEEHRDAYVKVVGDVTKVEAGLANINRITDAMMRILGHSQWQRYLMVFMNNNELRGTGGFMGSFALLDIDRGDIKNLEVPGGGTYDVQGQLAVKVIAPEPLHLINSRWEFQDSNWWPNFPTTAKKMQWFYESTGGPSTDGVIAMTATLMERLLNVVGPIEMPEYDTVITGDNFVEEAQTYSALEYDKEENKPKKLIADLAPKLMEKVFTVDKEQFQQLFETLITGLNEKQLLVYFNDPVRQDLIKDFGWDGTLKDTEGDYLSIVHTNIAGGKTDRIVKERIQHFAEVQDDGSIIATVILDRTHTGIRGENIFTGVQNNSYVRFYVPFGSEFIEAEGFERPPQDLFEDPAGDYQPDIDLISIEQNRAKDELSGTDIYNESGKTVFGNWLQLQPGETGRSVIKYRLPFSLASTDHDTFFYSLLAQKQHGSLGSEFSSNLILNGALKPLAKFPADLTSNSQEVHFNEALVTDQFYGVTLVQQ